MTRVAYGFRDQYKGFVMTNLNAPWSKTEVINSLSYALQTTGKLERGRVLAIDPNGDILVEASQEPSELVACDFLQTSEASMPQFRPGDQVLVHCDNASGRGCVLGRIVHYDPTEPRKAEPPQPALPDRLVIEAGQTLTLRCGEGTITITQDGRILIKGRDLVSRAKRTNRIKGGSVQIN
jgi:hypothetical protein